MKVNIHQAKTQLSQLITKAKAGEEVIIAKAGEPQVILVAVKHTKKRQPGRFAGEMEVSDAFFEPLPEEELQLWEGR